ncbi:MAG: hypothetical protein ACUVRR_05425 [Candidatus Fervidibacter sp.]|uniref:hypothetical protein n=1 Tax=Candidatus Fervidibacter sp. TaxID=3100871 RepID=UPI0040497508
MSSTVVETTVAYKGRRYQTPQFPNFPKDFGLAGALPFLDKETIMGAESAASVSFSKKR